MKVGEKIKYLRLEKSIPLANSLKKRIFPNPISVTLKEESREILRFRFCAVWRTSWIQLLSICWETKT
jgi:hypothetical protein